MRRAITRNLGLLLTVAAGSWLGSPRGSFEGAAAAEASRPEHLAAYRAAVAAFKEGRWSDALSRFQTVAGESSGHLRLCSTNMVGQIHRLQGRPAEARAAFADMARQAFAQKELRRGPEAQRADLLGRLALYYQAEICEQQQAWRGAIGFYEKLRELESCGVNRIARKPGLSPMLLEGLGRLYWRTGSFDKARETFEQSLATSPGNPRGPLIRLAQISLDGSNAGRDEGTLAWLFCPLARPDPEVAMPMTPMPSGLTSIPALPDAASLASSHLDRLLAEMPSDGMWRPVLLLERGWMQFEAERFDEAASVFSEAAGLATSAKSPWARRVRDYAELSSAICCIRQGRYADGVKLVQGVAERGPQGHVRAVAGSLMNSLDRRIHEKQAGAKCGVQTLK